VTQSISLNRLGKLIFRRRRFCDLSGDPGSRSDQTEQSDSLSAAQRAR